MSADGTWSGAAGKADSVRDVEVDNQFAIASITKTVIAAQVMQMVEAGELGLDDPATDHLPSDLDFDSNGATIRQLLGMRSGSPDYVDAILDSVTIDRQHRWTPTDVLTLVAADRSPAGDFFEYSSTNYVLLGLIIEQVRGRAVADVLRDGESSAAVEEGGGPSYRTRRTRKPLVLCAVWAQIGLTGADRSDAGLCMACAAQHLHSPTHPGRHEGGHRWRGGCGDALCALCCAVGLQLSRFAAPNRHRQGCACVFAAFRHRSQCRCEVRLDRRHRNMFSEICLTRNAP